MERSTKNGYIVSAILLVLAAFFSISLVVYILDFGSFSATHDTIFYAVGQMLASTYGFCSALIPLFFFISALVCISSNWTRQKAMRLLTAVVPFFTAVITENICRAILETGNSEFVVVKICVTIAVGLLLIITEILGAGFLAEMIAQRAEYGEQDKSHFSKLRSSKEANKESIIEKLAEKLNEKKSSEKIESSAQENFIDKKSINSEQNKNSEESPVLEVLSDEDEERLKKPSPFDDIFETEPTSVITEAEMQALTASTPSASDELDWSTVPVPIETFDILDVTEEIAEIESAPQTESVLKTKSVAQAVSEEDTIQTNSSSQSDSLDPDFFDIDINEKESGDYESEEIDADELSEDESIENNKSIDSEKKDDVVFSPFSLANSIFSEMDKDIKNEMATSTSTPSSTLHSSSQTVLSDSKISKKDSPVVPPKPKFKGPYKVPTDLLEAHEGDEYWIIDDETKNASVQLKETLNEFNIEADVIGIKKGPVVTMFEILPAPGVKLSKIAALQDNIALRLAASSVRIVAPIPGKRAVGIEIPNKDRSIVSFREIMEMDLPEYKKMAIPVILGKDILGKAQLLDLSKTPHLLIAGATGAGKSVCVNSMILSILYKRSPEEVRLILIDPKIVELKLYNNIPHLLVPVITESKKAFQSLQWLLCEMERRYSLLDGMGCRDISSYNRKIKEKNIVTEKLPYIVIIIDEFADLMATTGKELESTVARLAAMSRAVGIHLVLATQRPSIDVITGLIKANIPSRIAFMVASKMDSRIIIDQVGAEKLLGKGDMLYSGAVDPFPIRIQGTFVSDQEVENVVEHVKTYGEPDYIDEEIFVDDDEMPGEPSLFDDGNDPLYNQALEIVVQAGKASASYIQRRLKIGYNRAARLVEEMEERGIVGPANGSKPREIIHLP